MKIVTIIGTRPQFIKMVLLSQKFLELGIKEIIIHSGQHFDYNMSKIFFDNLDIPVPHYNINVNNLTVGNALGNMISEIEHILLKENPTHVIVYGDCNTTLAGALAANKLEIPIIHIESGLRSYDKRMPEEVNRILVDHMSNILFCPTIHAKKNLEKENIKENVYVVGDLMIELLRNKMDYINLKQNDVLKKYNLVSKNYYILTLHRQSNVNGNRFKYIFSELGKLSKNVIFPVHPRSKKIINDIPDNIIIIDPIDYIEMMILCKNAIKIITDSGGLQKEACELEVPCITLRENTEWVETVESGMNTLAYENIYKNILENNIINKYKYEDNTIIKIIKNLF